MSTEISITSELKLIQLLSIAIGYLSGEKVVKDSVIKDINTTLDRMNSEKEEVSKYIMNSVLKDILDCNHFIKYINAAYVEDSTAAKVTINALKVELSATIATITKQLEVLTKIANVNNSKIKVNIEDMTGEEMYIMLRKVPQSMLNMKMKDIKKWYDNLNK